MIHVQTYKVFYGIDTVPPEKFFITLMMIGQEAINSKFIYKQHSKTNLRKQFFSQRIVDLDNWNSLSSDIAESPTVYIFKNRLNRTRGHKFKIYL